MSVEQVRAFRDAVSAEVQRVVVGQQGVVDGVLVALVAGGHVLLEGVPGTAKTLLVKALARALGLDFSRIQFTPDLMPSDVVGTNVFDLRASQFHYVRGPVFTELLLADEINRAPAKTQSALLEAMQERQVSVDGQRHPLADTFTVLATQNPIEQEGTYPLPEAQLDRFLLKIAVPYPAAEDESEMLVRALGGAKGLDAGLDAIKVVGSRERLREVRAACLGVHVEPGIVGYVRDLVRATRTSPLVALGAGPRAAVHLAVASRCAAALDGRDFVAPDDVRSMLVPVLGHRLLLAAEVALEGRPVADVLDSLARAVEVPR